MDIQKLSLTTLQDEITQFKQESAGKRPPEAVAITQAEIDQLVHSGIAAHSLQVGDTAPSFTLPDAFGKAVTLSELLKYGPVIVSFYRGDWCPYCNLTLRAYQQILPSIVAHGGALVAVSPQTPDHSLTGFQTKHVTFPVLSDVGNHVARDYRLVFTLSEAMRPYSAQIPKYNGNDSYELPIPATFIVDRDRTVRYAFVDADFTHRAEPAALLKALRALK